MRSSSAPSENPPELIDEVAGDGFRQRTLKVPDTLGCLEGHFSGFPVVPAVVQLQWVMELAGEMTSRPPVLRRIEALKFKDTEEDAEHRTMGRVALLATRATELALTDAGLLGTDLVTWPPSTSSDAPCRSARSRAISATPSAPAVRWKRGSPSR